MVIDVITATSIERRLKLDTNHGTKKMNFPPPNYSARHLREVSEEEGKLFADKSGVATVETSALDSTNIDTAFQLLLTGIYEGMKVYRLSVSRLAGMRVSVHRPVKMRYQIKKKLF